MAKINQEFASRIDTALGNTQARENFRHAMDGFMAKRAAQFPDDARLQNYRRQDQAIRKHALHHLPHLLVQLETNLKENGVQVHWACDATEANQIIEGILQQHQAKKVVKGKSMVSEEIALNQYLEAKGYKVIETDLGEFIIQMAGETPSHIVVPAVHKNRKEIAQLFAKHFPEIPYTEEVDALTQTARKIMRDHFATADVGISGVNFMVAETGTLCLIENEGNGRMCTTVPPVHIAVTGIEKVVEKLSDLAPLLHMLPRSATGQPITTYVNMISSPAKAYEDGPKEVHLVLLDNGRSRIRLDASLVDTLQCIRCGACINHCPVYVRLGGHAYGTTYPGPIGSVLEPQRLGLEQAGKLASACSLCGACDEVCPVKIPLSQLIRRLRIESNNHTGSQVQGTGSLRHKTEATLWKVWQIFYAHPGLYRLMAWASSTFSGLLPKRLGGWTQYRSAPKPAKQSFHTWMRDREKARESR